MPELSRFYNIVIKMQYNDALISMYFMANLRPLLELTGNYWQGNSLSSS